MVETDQAADAVPSSSPAPISFPSLLFSASQPCTAPCPLSSKVTARSRLPVEHLSPARGGRAEKDCVVVAGSHTLCTYPPAVRASRSCRWRRDTMEEDGGGARRRPRRPEPRSRARTHPAVVFARERAPWRRYCRIQSDPAARRAPSRRFRRCSAHAPAAADYASRRFRRSAPLYVLERERGIGLEEEEEERRRGLDHWRERIGPLG
jgi:hypothetical protein